MATQDSEKYHAVLKASYDYAPQSDDEIAIEADQLLLLLEKVDDEWVTFNFIYLQLLTLIKVGGKSRSRVNRKTQRALLALFPQLTLNRSACAST